MFVDDGRPFAPSRARLGLMTGSRLNLSADLLVEASIS